MKRYWWFAICMLMSSTIAVTLFGCEKHIVFEDGIILKGVSVGKAYVGCSPWRVTVVETDQVEERCLFEMENIEKGTKHRQWVSKGDRFSLDPEESGPKIVLHKVKKGKAILGIPYGRSYDTYHLKLW